MVFIASQSADAVKVYCALNDQGLFFEVECPLCTGCKRAEEAFPLGAAGANSTLRVQNKRAIQKRPPDTGLNARCNESF